MIKGALKWAVEAKGLPPASKVILIQLALYHNEETGLCSPSVSKLAADCEVSLPSVYNHLRKLEQRGFLTRQRQPNGYGKMGANQYELHFDQGHGTGRVSHV